MLKNKRIFLISMLGIFCCGKIIAQTKPIFHTIESPNAAELKANVETPVSYEAGKASVNLPLVNVKDKDLEFSLALSHNSNGIKLDQHPGWTGQGWSLSQGVITRSIKGVPDETYWRSDWAMTIGGANTGSIVLPQGYAFNTNINDGITWNSTTRITDLAKDGSTPGTYWKEAEPDEFTFACGELSGTFTLAPNGTVIVKGRSDIRVEASIVYNIPLGFDASRTFNANDPYSYTSVSESYLAGTLVYTFSRSRAAYILGFRITGPDGKVYDFGQFDQNYNEASTFDEMEFTANVHDQFYASQVFTSWYMTKVASPTTGAAINFTYERGYPIATLGRSFSFYKMGGSAPARGFLGWLFGGVSSYNQSAEEEVDGKFIRPTYLKSITTSDTKIDFVRSASTELRYNYIPLMLSMARRADNYQNGFYAPSLYPRPMIGGVIGSTNYPPSFSYVSQVSPESFILYRKDGIIEGLDFGNLKWQKLDKISISKIGTSTPYRDVTFKYSNSSSQRLQLLDSDITKPYKFDYNSSTTLPGYLSMLIDHWGYFNDRFVQVDINSAQSLQDYKLQRGTVSSKLYAGMLSKVTFPTQGYKEFTYEPNTYKSLVARNSTTGAFSITSLTQAVEGGGLRIKEIKEVAGNGMPDMTTTYQYSDGLLNGDIQYYWPNYQGKLFNGNNYSSDRFVTESLLPTIQNLAGGVIAYQTVTEKKVGLGRTEYDFVPFSSNPDLAGNSIDPQKSVYSPFTDLSFARGQIKEKRVYEEGRTLPILKETNTYKFNTGLVGQSVRAVQARGLTLFGTTEVNAVEGTSYEHLTYPYQISKKTVQELDKVTGTYFSLDNEYVFDERSTFNDNQLKKLTSTNVATGESNIQNYKHTWDLTTGSLGTSYPEAAGITGLFNKHIIDRVISTNLQRKASSTSTAQYVSGQVDLYRLVGQTPLVYKTYELNLNAPVTSYTENFTTSSYQLDSKFSEKYLFNQYDNFANNTEITINTLHPQSFIWGNGGKNLMASFGNSALSDVGLFTAESANDMGGWAGVPTIVKTLSPVSGSVLNITGGGLSKSGLNTAKKYVFSYWTNSITPQIISPSGGGTVSGQEVIESKDGWTKFRCILSNMTSIYVTGASGGTRYMDDLLIYPYDADVKVYNYTDWKGVTNISDHTGITSYFEYDQNRRLKLQRDGKGYIVSDYQYNYRTP